MNQDKTYSNEIYIGTVLLEKNGWLRTERVPSVVISDWTKRIKEEGFDGIELWQNHALLASEEEQQKLVASPSPIKIFNSYARSETEAIEERQKSVQFSKLFNSEGMKYNFGRNAELHEEYTLNAISWRSMLPPQFRFLCECHGGTTMQTPAQASETFKKMGRENYEVIIHGFGGSDEEVKDAFAFHSDRITHIHSNISLKVTLDESVVQQRVDLLRSLGFNGSFTIEFTEGINSENENAETLFQNAVRDQKILRRCLLR